jgi:hypothetical protein
MEYRLGKVDAAVDQIDWAIRLLLDHNAHVPAITLAGAAEELLGKAIGESTAFQQMMDSLPGEYGIDPKVLSQRYLNRAKNWLKHWDPKTEAEYENFELQEEATQLIVRALANLIAYDRSLPSEGLRFFDWLKERGSSKT